MPFNWEALLAITTSVAAIADLLVCPVDQTIGEALTEFPVEIAKPLCAAGSVHAGIRASCTEFGQITFLGQPRISSLGPNLSLQFNSIRILLN
jgi:hypothetical protein